MLPDLAARLKAARAASGLTPAQLAVATGVSVATVGRWEAGKREPSAGRLRALAAALSIRIADLLPDAEAL